MLIRAKPCIVTKVSDIQADYGPLIGVIISLAHCPLPSYLLISTIKGM